MPNTKFYKVIDGPLSIRKTANGERSQDSLGHGVTIEIIGDAVTAGGYIWLEHAAGWSALAKEDGSETYMRAISDPNAPFIYQVQVDNLSIREEASGKRTSKLLSRDTKISVDPKSRTEKGGYIWWQHDTGWSAERSINNSEILMQELFDATTGTLTASGSIANQSIKTATSDTGTSSTEANISSVSVAKKSYVVIDGPLSIRKKANGERTGKNLAQGEEISVFGEPVTDGGYVWVQHDLGWSAYSTDNESEIYMYDLSKRDPDAPRVFRVVSDYVTIRESPAGARLTKKLYNNMEVNVDPQSRTEKGLYIWWKHDDGWTAQCSLDGREVYLKEVFDQHTLNPVDTNAKAKIPAHWKGKFYLQVADDVSVRAKPSIDTWTQIIRYLKRGDSLECDMDTLTEADNYYWVQHNMGGWSAIERIDGKVVFLAEPGTIPGLVAIGPDGPKAEDLPNYHALFTRLPVGSDDTEWFQYFGNIMFAMRNGKAYGYDAYSQGLHGGLDFGNSSKPAPIYAGIDAEYWKIEYPSKNNTRIFLKKDDYIIIYQHITGEQPFTEGQAITPDTLLAYTEHQSINNGWNHLHLEVRFMVDWIVNPLLLFPDALRNTILTNFDPKKPNTNYQSDFPKSQYNFFYKTDTWTKWTSPYEQPMLKLAGPIIGPKAELPREEW